jgi:predicted ATPase
MALSTGEADEELREGDYRGSAVNRCARLRSSAHGGQILCSETTHALVQSELPAGVGFRDLGIHRLRDIGHEHLWQLLHPALPSEFPPPQALDPERHNLPLPPSPFVGRDTDLAAWHALLLRPTTRILMLVGVSGVGKSRVALHLAELCTGDFDDGVWWVDLQEIQTGEAMVQRIAHDLRLVLQPQLPIKGQLLAFLRSHRLLLVLDNTEQIGDAAEAIHELSNTAPSLRCLVTARRALGLRAESVVEVRPLTSAEAEALFVERARSHDSRFVLTAENAADVTDLCRRLEGVPLAVELAASRIAGMTPHEMLHRLDQRFRLLQSDAPDLPPRQRAMQAAIDWSHALLAEEHQRLLAQLSVFAGGFTLADAEAVCEAVCEGGDVFEGVLELRSSSLLRAETHGPTQQTRYRMLETVREYAAEKLRHLPDEGQSVWQRHNDYFLDFAGQRVARMRTREEAQALDELGSEYDNLRAALAWAQENEQGELCARLALALFPLLYRRGLWAEARGCLQAGQAATEGLDCQGRGLQAAIACHLASLAHDMGELAAACQQGEACLALWKALGDNRGMAEALNLLGYVATDQGDLEDARRRFEEALGLCAEDEHNQRALVLHNLARLASQRGEMAEAKRLYEEAIGHRRAIGDARGEAETLGNLGALAQKSGDPAEAGRLYRESLAGYRTHRYPYGIAVMLNNLGELAELAGEVEVAAALFTHAERMLRELQSADARHPADSLSRLAGQLGEERWVQLQTKLQGTTWEELVAGRV